MPRIPLPIKYSRSSDETSLPDQIGVRLVNAWVEMVGNTPIIHKMFGLKGKYDLGVDYPVDGLFWWDTKDCLIAVSSGRVYVLTASDADGFRDITGDALTVLGPVTFACNRYQAILASGGKMVSINVENLPDETPGLAIGSTVTAVSNAEFDYYIGQTSYTFPAIAAGTAPGNDEIPSGKYGAVAFDIVPIGFCSSPNMRIGTSANTSVLTSAFGFYIAGTLYAKGSIETAPGNDVIPQNKYGAVALDIGADGTIDVIEAADNAAGYNTAALAIAGIAAAAAGHIRLGTVSVVTTNAGGFTFGTTALNHADATVVYTNSTSLAITAVEASANSSGYNSAAEAIEGIPNCSASVCRIGVVTAMMDDAVFIFGTDSLADAHAHVTYTSYIRNSECGIQATRFISSTTAPTTVSHVAWMDGYFLANEVGSGRFWWSDADEPLTWGALSFSSAEGHPDFIGALHVAWLEITLFGRDSLETYYNDGSSPFSRIDGGVLERGCLAPHTIVNAGGTWVWLDNYRKVVTLSGRKWQAVSEDYDDVISEIVDVRDAWAVHFTVKGQDFYVITFPTENLTLAWNMTSNTWSELGTWDSTTATFSKWKGKSYCYARSWDLHLFGASGLTGAIYKMTGDYYKDDGALMRTYMRTAHYTHGLLGRKRSRAMRLNVKRGQGDIGGSEPVFTMRHRDNGEGPWSNERQISLGKIGEYSHISEIRGLGTYRTRQWEIVHTDNSDFLLSGLEEDVEALA